jgi:hypothetical protein
MTWLDLFIAPLYIFLFFIYAYMLKPFVTDKHTEKYYIPGFAVKIIGAIAVGLIYQFYYKGGDTYNFYHNSTQVFNAFIKSPWLGIKLLFLTERFGDPDLADFTAKMYFFRDSSSLFVIKIAGLFSYFAFNSYTVIACMFATFSYSGLWNLYRTFYRIYPHLHRPLAYAILFVPSVVFWGSGYLKDTITLAAVGWAVYAIHQMFFLGRNPVRNTVIILIAGYLIAGIKIYILLCIMPAFILWVFLRYNKQIKHPFFRYMTAPFVFVFALVAGYYAVKQLGQGNRYSLENVSQTAQVTAEWLAYVGETEGGSIYTLGDFDYSPAGMLRKALPAINVTLFRPYLWEVRNPIMLLSALESLFFLFFTIYVLYKRGVGTFFKTIRHDPTVLFCIIYSLSFAFAIGISTYNFGSLVRYKIPMMPFYLTALLVILYPTPRRRLQKGKRIVRRRVRSVALPQNKVAWT